jgi:hypothetical protein
MGRTANTNHAHVHELLSARVSGKSLAEARVDKRKTTGRRYETKKGNTARGLSSLPFRAFATSNAEAGRRDRAGDIRRVGASRRRARSRAVETARCRFGAVEEILLSIKKSQPTTRV